jgi:hypothetical protein
MTNAEGSFGIVNGWQTAAVNEGMQHSAINELSFLTGGFHSLLRMTPETYSELLRLRLTEPFISGIDIFMGQS